MDTIRKTIKARTWKDGKEIHPEDQALPVNQVDCCSFKREMTHGIFLAVG